jgi:hypothetical protein
MPGFAHRTDAAGFSEFELELISSPEVGIKGFSYMLDDRIQVLSNPYLPNTGYVRQIVPGRNFPATFHIRRFGILETSSLRLAHRDVIDIEGVIDGIPPYKKPLTTPYLGVPRGDGPTQVVPAPNVVRGINLPEAWYPADSANNPVGITPTVFFAESMGPCPSMLVDPTLIIQSSAEATITVQTVTGTTEQINLVGQHRLAAGAEILLYGPEKHADGDGILAQITRLALVGNSPALGGRVMLRVSFTKVSGGTLGDGSEDAVSSLRFPSELQVDAQLEIATPTGVLYTPRPTHLTGTLTDLQPTGTELRMAGPTAGLETVDRTTIAELTDVHLLLGEAIVGEQAFVTT